MPWIHKHTHTSILYIYIYERDKARADTCSRTRNDRAALARASTRHRTVCAYTALSITHTLSHTCSSSGRRCVSQRSGKGSMQSFKPQQACTNTGAAAGRVN